jgi:hypothetical protein
VKRFFHIKKKGALILACNGNCMKDHRKILLNIIKAVLQREVLINRLRICLRASSPRRKSRKHLREKGAIPRKAQKSKENLPLLSMKEDLVVNFFS